MMDLWLFSESKLRTKFDTIRHCEERSAVASNLSPFHNTCPLNKYRAIIKQGNAQTIGHLHVIILCPKWTLGRQWSDWRPFFSLLLIKVRKNCNNSADNCCCTCNNSNKPVNIHCKASSNSNSG